MKPGMPEYCWNEVSEGTVEIRGGTQEDEDRENLSALPSDEVRRMTGELEPSRTARKLEPRVQGGRTLRGYTGRVT